MLNTLFSSGKRPSKSHWVPDAKATHCAARGCGKLFDTKIRRHHCRRCGLVFCDEHLAHRMRLNAQAEPDEEGEMSKVCESCFMKQLEPATPAHVHVNHVLVVHRAGEVTSRSRSDLFRAHRAEYNKEMSRRSSSVIEVYEKVRQLSSRRDRKQVVNWEPDAKTPRCSGCKRAFTAVLRKHHCRLCGTVICSDCSLKHKPARAAGGARAQDVMIGEDNTVRACRQCDEYICRWERSQAEARVRAEAKQSPFMLQYISLATTHTTVRELLRHFEQQVTMLGTRGATATVEDAKQVETALSQMLPALGNAIKRFVTSEVQPNEVALREGAKVWVRFAPTALLQESTPRFHALKRQLEAKAAQKAMLASPPDADGALGVSAGSCVSSPTASSTAAASTAATSAAIVPTTARTSCALIGPKAEGSECVLTAGLPPAGEAEAWAQAPLFPPAATATTRGELSPDSTASSGAAASAPSLVWPPSDERLPVWPPRPPSSTNPFALPAPSPVARVAPQAFPARPPAAGPPTSLIPKPSSPSPSQSPPPMKASAPAHDVVGPINAPLAKLGAGDPRIELAEFLMAKKSLVDLSRSSLSYSDPMLQSVERLEEIKETLQRAMYYLTEELQYWATPLRLDWNGQLREITAAIAAPRPNDSGPRFASTKEDLLSKLLGVAVGACSRIDDDVSDKVFVRSRGALHQLKSLLKEVYMHECIPY